MKWFNPKAIIKEIGKIRWPNKEDLATSSVQVLIWIGLFALFFYLCQFLVTLVLSAMGVM